MMFCNHILTHYITFVTSSLSSTPPSHQTSINALTNHWPSPTTIHNYTPSLTNDQLNHSPTIIDRLSPFLVMQTLHEGKPLADDARGYPQSSQQFLPPNNNPMKFRFIRGSHKSFHPPLTTSSTAIRQPLTTYLSWLFLVANPYYSPFVHGYN